MNRSAWISVTFIVLVTLFVSFVSGQSSEDVDSCIISENYNEASGENTLSMIRIFSYLGDDGIWDAEINTINLHYALLISMRDYYEDAQAQLPDCAQHLNNSYIRVIASMSDVLAYNWGVLANTDAPTYYINRANLAKDDLNAEWATLSQINQTTTFTVE